MNGPQSFGRDVKRAGLVAFIRIDECEEFAFQLGIRCAHLADRRPPLRTGPVDNVHEKGAKSFPEFRSHGIWFVRAREPTSDWGKW